MEVDHKVARDQVVEGRTCLPLGLLGLHITASVGGTSVMQ